MKRICGLVLLLASACAATGQQTDTAEIVPDGVICTHADQVVTFLSGDTAGRPQLHTGCYWACASVNGSAKQEVSFDFYLQNGYWAETNSTSGCQ